MPELNDSQAQARKQNSRREPWENLVDHRTQHCNLLWKQTGCGVPERARRQGNIKVHNERLGPLQHHLARSLASSGQTMTLPSSRSQAHNLQTQCSSCDTFIGICPTKGL
eukprot:5139373-Amphidinium_carterae.2